MSVLNLKVTPVFEKNYDALSITYTNKKGLVVPKKIIVNQGGTRSSKTYSIMQLIITLAHELEDSVITIVRKTMPALKATAMRDFLDILKDNDLYNENYHNKTENTYTIGTNLVEFMSMDSPQKKRGAKRSILVLNEANELTLEDFKQLIFRTTYKVFLDYNPSDEYHWIYEKVIPRDDCHFIQSTYLDNPFLEETIIDEIERLKDEDPEYWQIYGLGEKGVSQQTIYTKYDVIDVFPESLDDEKYAIDFGYNNPMVLLHLGLKDAKEVFVEELIYERRLTTNDLVEKMKDLIPLQRRHIEVRCDNAEPDRIEELKRSGFNAVGAKKGKVKDSIDVMKRVKIHVTKRSVNTLKEIRGYKWKKDKEDHILDEPVKFMDHAMDAMRYGYGCDDEGEKIEKHETVYQEDVLGNSDINIGSYENDDQFFEDQEENFNEGIGNYD